MESKYALDYPLFSFRQRSSLMIFLGRFLFGNLKGYRLLVVVTFIVTILEVIVAGQIPFVTKFIIDKAAPPHTDPSLYGGILSLFNPVKAGQQHDIIDTII